MISVIIPTFNRAHLLKRCITSIINQTYKDIEIIIVDDASTDNTSDIISELSHDKIRYYKLKENKGACYARNYGVQKALGEYIAFQDSDDVWNTDKLQKQINYLIEKNADLVFCSFTLHTEEKKIEFPPQQIDENKISKLILKYNFVSTQTILAKKECLIDIPFDNDIPRLQDWDLMIRFTQKFKVYHLHESLVTMYQQTDSISKNKLYLIKALEIIRQKYSKIGLLDKKSNAKLHALIGKLSINLKLPAYSNYWQAFKLTYQIKYLIMFILLRFFLNQHLIKVLLKSKSLKVMLKKAGL